MESKSRPEYGLGKQGADLKQLYPGDRSHRMPIITPAYPAMCATHNVTESTQMIMMEEFKKGTYSQVASSANLFLPDFIGADIVDKIVFGSLDWSTLFAKHDFFHKYRYYLQVIASTGNPDLQLKWYSSLHFLLCQSLTCSARRAGTVESRIRQLVMKLEFVESLTLAHPFVKGFEQSLHCLNEEEVRQCATGEVSEAVLRRKKEDIEGKEGASTIYITTFYIGLAIEPKQRAYSVCSAL